LAISTDSIKELREKCGAGVIECRNVLVETEGNVEKALCILKERGFAKAAKKAERVTKQGLVEAYVHAGGRVGAMVELNCETDFVARTPDFKELAHNIAMQVAAMSPAYITEEEVPEGAEVVIETDCHLKQPYIRDPGVTINDIIVALIAKVGENIRVSRIARFELGK
jgi:elongation factor Ts